jgi:hypothetical protein
LRTYFPAETLFNEYVLQAPAIQRRIFMNSVLLLYSIAATSYGIAVILFPGFLIPLLWDNPPGSEAYILVQGWGACLLGFGIMAFLARKSDESAQRTILTGILIYFAGAVITWLIDSLKRGWTIFGAISFATYILFAVPFVYLLFIRKANT